MANLFSKAGMRRFKQGFLESIGVADNTREEDKEFEHYTSRFNSAATGLREIHAKLKDYIRTQEELSLASAGVFAQLSALSSAIPTSSTHQDVASQLKTCSNAQELIAQTVSNPSKKYFQRTVLRPCEVMAKKVNIIASLIVKCRGLYVDVDAFKHKYSSELKKDPSELKPKTRQFHGRLRDFTTELGQCKAQLFTMVDRFETETKLLVESLVQAFVAYQVHTSTRSGDLMKVVGERLPNVGAHMVELGCLTGRARGASVLVPDAQKPRPTLKLREYLQLLLTSRPNSLAPPVQAEFPARLPFTPDMPFDAAHSSVRPVSLPAPASAQKQAQARRTQSANASGPSVNLAQTANPGSGSTNTSGKSGNGGSSSRASPATSPPKPKKEVVFVTAKFDYKKKENDELTICKGDKIRVVKKHDSGWWYGETRGEKGFFPSAYTA